MDFCDLRLTLNLDSLEPPQGIEPETFALREQQRTVWLLDKQWFCEGLSHYKFK